ncbi:MAG: chorismate-binding protein [Lautropia sp.]|nr:chorismate-binding protein [Lautropia sp.]
MTELEFKALAAQGYNRIPVVLQTLADLDSPLGLYLKLTDANCRRNSFLLESVVGGERFGRYSFIGLPARTAIRAKGSRIEVVRDAETVESATGDPLAFVQQYQKRNRVHLLPGMPRFCGGLAGYFGYDVVHFIEPRVGHADKPDPIGVPDLLLLIVDELAIIDNLSGMIYLIVYADPTQPEAYGRACERLNDLRMKMRNAALAPEDLLIGNANGQVIHTPVERPFAKEDYLATVAAAREHIIAGDLMQVQIGQMLRKPFPHSALSLYRALRSINPSPYMYYYDFGDFHVTGSSPEILVRQEMGAAPRVTLRPIAGTRKRGLTEAEDAHAAAELLADPKERAEHLMLIDLARNDIGRLAKVGTVKVTEQMAIEKYSHVIHLVSNVEGLLEQRLDAIDILRATFPAGTLTGAPKVRAMELIEELEPVKRGIYGGACGYLSYSGEMDVAIAIRTGVIKDGMLNVQAAAGVVYDSVPENEWQETEMKARAVLRAAEMVESGLANGGS